MSSQFGFYAYIIFSIWLLYISWRMYTRRRLKGQLIFTLGVVISIFAPSLPSFGDFFIAIGTILFCIGFILMSTVDYKTMRESIPSLTLKDVLLGKIPQEQADRKIGPHQADNAFFLWLLGLLMALSTIIYFFFGIKMLEWALFTITFAGVIMHRLFKKWNNKRNGSI